MPTHRMDRDEFFAKLAGLDEAGLRKALWTLYWRGSAPMRERIEAQLDPGQRGRQRRREPEPADPVAVLDEVTEFVALARNGAYLGGDRRVSPKERSRWRVMFRRLATEAQAGLGVEDAEDADAATEAVALLVDLACQTRGYDYFRSDDPMHAARFVVSDAVAVLWGSLRDRRGFAGFAESAAPQLIRWESPFGWTRYGAGQVVDRETSLAEVLAGMLPAPDQWTGFAGRYLDALDRLRDDPAPTRRPYGQSAARDRQDRARRLAAWHDMLVDRLAGSEDEHLLDRLAVHPALAGPELTFLQARLAHERGDLDRARARVRDCLKELPGHAGFAEFARLVGAG